MSANSSIEWTEKTWNPVRGCSIVSPGCVNCYAMKQAHRFGGPGKPYEGLTKQTKAGPQWTGQVRTVESALLEPLSWRKPQRVFVNSMSDLFHEDVPFEFVDRVFATMAAARRHTFQVLTKRADRMLEYLTAPIGFSLRRSGRVWTLANDMPGCEKYQHSWPLPNVWLGVSVEDQQHADERIPLLLQTPATVRFISAEPLLGPVDLQAVPIPAPGADFYGLKGVAQPLSEKDTEPDDWKYWTRRGAKLDWVIVGGESGPGARPCALEWIQFVVGQCRAASVPVFVKQLGAYVVSEERTVGQDLVDLFKPRIATRMVKAPNGEYWGWRAGTEDRKGGDPSEWPEDLRVREFPEVRP